MERRQVMHHYNIARRIRKNDSDPFTLEDGEFVRLFRLTKDLNVQLICDSNLKVLAVNARYAGATHDAAIWNNSDINEYLNQCFRERDRNTWLLGDSGYPQLPWLMTPILHPTPGAEELYNQRLSSARNCIERCNGVLKGRFRCILGERVLRYSPEKVGMITNVCVILQNMCVEARLPNDDIHQQQDNLQLNVVNNEEQHNQEAIPLVQDGRQARRNLIRRYFQ
ncbi:hypothetical protein ILUMI_16196 [Ignelater luminosus]|uniref:DDE Tnp4 domain-containing protein n=1 Tax=Ignelater luminosus TaxID=2038154 RepID=A0A8K0G968_IGNLU|nr:hypothetical protein ILUMI_16196 [Ignelater luminosus]